MTVIVTHSDTSKSGKPRVYFDGNNNWKDAYYLGPKCPEPPKGVPLEVQTHSWRPENGKSDMWFLDSFSVSTESPGTWPHSAPLYDAIPPRSTPPVTSQPPRQNVAPAGYTEPERMWMSNIVAAAINAGCVKSPVDLITWTNGALTAIRMVKVAKDSDFDPEVGF